MKLANVLHLYRVRLRARAAAGVSSRSSASPPASALLFASQIASQSLSSSVGQLNSGIVGHATLQLTARDPHGFTSKVCSRRCATSRACGSRRRCSKRTRTRVGPKGSESVAARRRRFEPHRTRRRARQPRRPDAVRRSRRGRAARAGRQDARRDALRRRWSPSRSAGELREAALYAQLYEKQIGALIDSPIALAPLEYAQELDRPAGPSEPHPGRAGARPRSPGAGGALQRLAGDRLNVQSSDYDEKLFAKAAAATNQSTALFAVISALVGLPVRVQRDAAHRAPASPADRRPAPRRLHPARR